MENEETKLVNTELIRDIIREKNFCISLHNIYLLESGYFEFKKQSYISNFEYFSLVKDMELLEELEIIKIKRTFFKYKCTVNFKYLNRIGKLTKVLEIL